MEVEMHFANKFSLTVIGLLLVAGVAQATDDADERNPDEVLSKSRERLAALAAKYELLKGVADVKTVTERDEKDRPESAQFVFERNSAPTGKARKASDETKPFVYVSLQYWSGQSQQPPGGLRFLKWKGQTYQMWLRVFGSDPELVKAVQKAIDDPFNQPPVPAK
jgi:hypothetical protein